MPGDDYKRLIVLLEEIRDQTTQSHKILKKMRRDAVIGSILKWTMWLFFLLSPVVIYYHYKPALDAYMEKVQSMYTIIMTTEIPKP